MNKRQVGKIILFLAILLILIISLSYIMRTNGNVKNRFVGFYAQKKNSIDVLMFGASPIGTSFAPGYIWEQYGITSYPLSSNSQRAKAIKYLIEEGYRYQNPEVIVIELRMFAYPDEQEAKDTPHIREVVDNMRYSFHRIKTIQELTDQVDEPIYTFIFDFFKYHSNLGVLLQKEEWLNYRFVKEDVNKGFENPMDWIGGTSNLPDVEMNQTLPISLEQEEYLRELCEYLKNKNQKTLFIVTPKWIDEEYQSKMNYMKQIVENYGFQYINLNEEHDDIGYSFATDFKEGAHTNILGAKKCSDYLGKYLQETYQIEDKRGKAGYESWDKSAKAFEVAYAQMKEKIERELEDE